MNNQHEPTPVSFTEAIAAYVSAHRTKHNLTLDAVATAGRRYGASWGTASIRNIEAGTFSPTLPMLMTLALALGDLSGTPLRLSDLLGDAAVLDLPLVDQTGATRAWVDSVLAGEAVTVPQTQRSSEPSGDRVSAVHPAGVARPRASLADQRAAVRLDLRDEELAAITNRLWGHSLAEESTLRAGAQSTAQARGRVTRTLMREIAAHLET